MSIQVHIVNGPLRDGRAARVVEGAEGAGAMLCFEGVVRPLEDGRRIAGLHYQVYEPMASRMLRLLAEEACERFRVQAVFVEHSRGDVLVGQYGFRLTIAATHRKEALAAMDHFIDRLKADVPIWKRPISEGKV